MGPWGRFKRWLFSSAKRPNKFQHSDLYPLHVEDIAKELALEEEGKRLGEAGIPAPDATDICGAEAKIVQRMEKARQDYADWASLRLAVLNEDLSRCDVTQVVNRALQADSEFERKASAMLAESVHLTQDLAKTASSRLREYQEFRESNQLRRDPDYPTTSGTFLRYAILALLIVIEGIANAYFFSQGLTSGLIGGFVAAAIFAGLNLIVAFTWGKFVVPYIYHRKPERKLVGFLGIAAALACMIGISLMIAHFRDALVADLVEPTKAAWDAMKAMPFGLHDIMSWILFGVSFVFAVFALIDGLSSDDVYPGYGKIARKASEARADYLEEVEHIRNQLEDLKEEELASLDNALNQAQKLVSQFSSLMQDKISAESRLQLALSNAEHCMDALIKIFRDANEMHRKGLSRPGYFNSRPQVKHLALPDFGLAVNSAVYSEQQLLVNELLSKAVTIRANIQASFNREYDRLKPLDEHFESTRSEK